MIKRKIQITKDRGMGRKKEEMKMTRIEIAKTAGSQGNNDQFSYRTA